METSIKTHSFSQEFKHVYQFMKACKYPWERIKTQNPQFSTNPHHLLKNEEATLTDVISGWVVYDPYSSSLLSLINEMIQNISNKINSSDRSYLYESVTDFIRQGGHRVFQFTGLLLALHHLLDHEELQLGSVTCPGINDNDTDFILKDESSSHNLLIEVHNIFLNNHSIQNAPDLKELLNVTNSTTIHKTKGIEQHLITKKVFVVWGTFQELKVISGVIKSAHPHLIGDPAIISWYGLKSKSSILLKYGQIDKIFS